MTNQNDYLDKNPSLSKGPSKEFMDLWNDPEVQRIMDSEKDPDELSTKLASYAIRRAKPKA